MRNQEIYNICLHVIREMTSHGGVRSEYRPGFATAYARIDFENRLIEISLDDTASIREIDKTNGETLGGVNITRHAGERAIEYLIRGLYCNEQRKAGAVPSR